MCDARADSGIYLGSQVLQSRGVRESRTKPKSKRRNVWELRVKPETRAKLEKKRRRDPPQKNRTWGTIHSFWCLFEINDNIDGSRPCPVVTNPRLSLNSSIFRSHLSLSKFFQSSIHRIKSLAVWKAFSHEPPTSHYKAYHTTAEQRSWTFFKYE